ncbi:MAG TPA: tRNA (5-methylaminomethyl-2-thiouridylate)-methyltransferase [Opitutaceae bacterium]|nr:tRNA (5-methylaminomethyl-2-thiouridylate)-methyltransferase [Opitutaceae bacterium]
MTVEDHRVRTIHQTLYYTYGIVPIVAGLDKFTNLLTRWETYLNPDAARILGANAGRFMEVVGIVEIIAGFLVFFRPRIGGFVVAGWLALIALSLLAAGQFLDVAVRDLAMAIGALTLARLTPVAEDLHLASAD